MENPLLDFLLFVDKSTMCVCVFCLHAQIGWYRLAGEETKDLPFGHEPVCACTVCTCDWEGKRQKEIRIQKHDCTHLLLIAESRDKPTSSGGWQHRRTETLNENMHWDHDGEMEREAHLSAHTQIPLTPDTEPLKSSNSPEQALHMWKTSEWMVTHILMRWCWEKMM